MNHRPGSCVEKDMSVKITLAVLGLLTAFAIPAAAAPPPDYKVWGELLGKYYDPAQGMNYKGLKEQDKKTLDALRERMGAVDVNFLTKEDRLAYWINLYNISVVGIVVDNYPIESIKDLSTDPLIRLNIFKKPLVKTKQGMVSLNDIENEKIRDGFKDARIHFAINCAAESCPPIRLEPYVGSKVNQQLEDQTIRFLNGPQGVRTEKKGAVLVLHVTKVMDWFEEDFNKWAGGQLAFLNRYLIREKQKQLEAAGNQVKIEFDDYSWELNDTSK